MDKHSDQAILEILGSVKSLAIVGARADGPAYYVPEYLQKQGYAPIPVTPKGGEIWGVEAVASLESVEKAPDAVVLFRRSEAIPGHVPEILALDPLPKLVWMQKGIENAQAAEELEAQGIFVVQDRCMMVEHKRLS